VNEENLAHWRAVVSNGRKKKEEEKSLGNIYLLTPWIRVLLEKLTSKLCS